MNDTGVDSDADSDSEPFDTLSRDPPEDAGLSTDKARAAATSVAERDGEDDERGRGATTEPEPDVSAFLKQQDPETGKLRPETHYIEELDREQYPGNGNVTARPLTNDLERLLDQRLARVQSGDLADDDEVFGNDDLARIFDACIVAPDIASLSPSGEITPDLVSNLFTDVQDALFAGVLMASHRFELARIIRGQLSDEERAEMRAEQKQTARQTGEGGQPTESARGNRRGAPGGGS